MAGRSGYRWTSKHLIFLEQLPNAGALVEGGTDDVLALAHRERLIDHAVDHGGRDDQDAVNVAQDEIAGCDRDPADPDRHVEIRDIEAPARGERRVVPAKAGKPTSRI